MNHGDGFTSANFLYIDGFFLNRIKTLLDENGIQCSFKELGIFV